jgi:hypothetical protein
MQLAPTIVPGVDLIATDYSTFQFFNSTSARVRALLRRRLRHNLPAAGRNARRLG